MTFLYVITNNDTKGKKKHVTYLHTAWEDCKKQLFLFHLSKTFYSYLL